MGATRFHAVSEFHLTLPLLRGSQVFHKPGLLLPLAERGPVRPEHLPGPVPVRDLGGPGAAARLLVPGGDRAEEVHGLHPADGRPLLLPDAGGSPR